MDIGGVITMDVMTLISTGDKYYDFNFYYFKVSPTSLSTPPTTHLKLKLLFFWKA